MEITIATLMAGRDYSLDAYLWGLSIIDYPKDKIHLLWMSNSDNIKYHKKASEELAKLKDYASRRYIKVSVAPPDMKFLKCGKHNSRYANTVAELYTRVYSEIETEWFLFLEDDVIAPSNTMDLLKCYKGKIGYACGTIMDRRGSLAFVFDVVKKKTFPKGDACKEMQYVWKHPKKPYGKRDIGLGHFGLTLLRRSVVDKIRFRPTAPEYGGGIFGCDLLYCIDIAKLGYKIMCDYNVRGLHLDSKGKIH